jgi:hypothetical protein
VRSNPLAVSVVIMAILLAGCSGARVTASDEDGAGTAPTVEEPAFLSAKPPVGQLFANVELDDRQLGGIRGGLSTGSGMIVNFSFQEATYVNHNLAQSIVVPTITLSPGSNPGSMANNAASALSIQSILNNGMTSIVGGLGGGGVSNTISNAANNQLVQQMITANIGVTGLSQTIQQSVGSSVASRLAAANSQFR